MKRKSLFTIIIVVAIALIGIMAFTFADTGASTIPVPTETEFHMFISQLQASYPDFEFADNYDDFLAWQADGYPTDMHLWECHYTANDGTPMAFIVDCEEDYDGWESYGCNFSAWASPSCKRPSAWNNNPQ